MKEWQQKVLDQFCQSEHFCSDLFILDNGLNNQLWTVHPFAPKSNSKDLLFTSKETSGYLGQVDWYWIKCSQSLKISALARTTEVPLKYLWVQVNLHQLPAETAGIHYLRKNLPASAGNSNSGTIYLRPSQVISDVLVLQSRFLESTKN